MPRKMSIGVEDAKKRVLQAISTGATVEQAMKSVGRLPKTYENWRASDDDFARQVNAIRASKKAAKENGLDPEARNIDFATWRKRYLGRDTHPHMHAMIDTIEGRDPVLQTGWELRKRRPDRIIINTPPNVAKALALNTPVPTPNGFKTIGELCIGDEVFGLDGKPTAVVGKSEVFNKPCFEVSVDSGEAFVASGDHLWTLAGGAVKTTAEIAEAGAVAKLPGHGELGTDAQDFILDPYVLGAWLGDGHTSCGNITSADPEIIAEIESAGFSCKALESSRKGRASLYAVSGLFPVLSELGVRGRKYIPEGYLLGSREQRLALLQGLMDTDGTINRVGFASFSNTNRDLADGVLYLASSLGLRPRIIEKRAKIGEKDCGPYWWVGFTPGQIPVFRLKRKLKNQTIAARGRGGHLRRIRSIAPTKTVPTQCIRVDNESHTFLIGKSLVPTHNSNTVTIDWVTYRLCMNLNTKVLIISQTREMADRFLYQIKKYLTDPQYLELQQTYAPDGQFKGDVWGAQQIYLNGRDPDMKDANVQSVGWGSQIQGQRADIVIMDDVVTLTNVGDPAKMAFRVSQDVMSRLTNGKLIIVGTRVGPNDLYEHLLDDENFNGKSPWTHLKMPMVSKFFEDPKDWITIWPFSTERMDENDESEPDDSGRYPAWDGPACAKKRGDVPPKVWSLLYQQEVVSDDSTFSPECVMGSVTRRRAPGPMVPGAIDHRPGGLEGACYVIATMDPAMTGDTFTLVGAVDKETKKRYIMNAWVKQAPSPQYLRDMIRDVTETFGVNEWRIEQNAFQLFLVYDEEIQNYLRGRGVKITGHYTSRNKLDPDFGVASVASLFGYTRKVNDGAGRATFVPDSNLIYLPDPDRSEGIRTLIEELIAWQPGVRGKDLRQDGPMALWFFELAARDIVNSGRSKGQTMFRESSFLTRGARSRRAVINLADYRPAAVGE